MKQPHNSFTVCVHCFTYNQSSFIVETLDGFTMQKTTFPYVCAIVDDASTDGEQTVINRYLEENFDLDDILIVRKEETCDYTFTYARHKRNILCYFAVFYLKTNHYSKPEMRGRKFEYIKDWNDRAKYIAICEGDDYWIDCNKLQNQVDYLESHLECGLVYTKAKVYSEQESRFVGCVGENCNSFSELLLKNSIPTLTVMFRTDIYFSYYENIVPSNRGWKMGDYPLWLYIAANRNIHFIDETTSVYRANEGSASRPASYKAKVAYLESSKKVRLFFCEKYNRKDQLKAIERCYEESCLVASIDYKRIKDGMRIIIKSKYLSLPRRVILMCKLIMV